MTPEEELRTIATKAANILLRHPWKVWFWGDSIGLEGLLDASEITGDGQYGGYVYGLFKGWIARERCRSEFDYTAPGIALLRVFQETNDPALLSAARRHANYMAGFRRTESGAFVRYEDAAFELMPEIPASHSDFASVRESAARTEGGPCIFVDSMHFDAPFFAALHLATGEDEYRQLALDNVLSHIELLYDPVDRLFHHFWMERTRSRNGIAWGRGNGWGLLGLVETLEHLPAQEPAVGEVHRVLEKVLRRMVELQDVCGGWHTVLNDFDSYIETSIAAFMVNVLSRAILHFGLDVGVFGPVVRSAWSFLLEHVSPDGLLEGVSYETFPSTRVEHYRRMPRGAMVPWGQGPLLAALRWYSQLQRSERLNVKHLGSAPSACVTEPPL